MEKERSATDQEYAEAHRLNDVVDKVNETRDAFNTESIKPLGLEKNTIIAEKNVLIRDRIQKLEQETPELTEWLDIANEGVEKAFPEYANNLNIRDYLFTAEYMKEIEDEFFDLDDVCYREGFINIETMLIYIRDRWLKEEFAPVILTHEFVHMISFGKGEKVHRKSDAMDIYKSRSGVSEDEIEFLGSLKNIQKQAEEGKALNEYLTNYFTIEALSSLGEERTKEYMELPRTKITITCEYEVIKLLADLVGDNVLRKAYFEGNLNGLVEAVGKENFDYVSRLLDTSYKGLGGLGDIDARMEAVEYIKKLKEERVY